MESSSFSSSAATRKPCFLEEEDDGLASLAEMEVGFSGYYQNAAISSHLCCTRRSSLRNLYYSYSLHSPRSVGGGVSGRFHDSRFECNNHQPYFLDSCFLCKKPLGDNRDIFMYRGDTPFCSEDCRQEQIERDESKEKKQSLSSMKALRRKEQRRSSSPTKSQDYPFHTGTVAAA